MTRTRTADDLKDLLEKLVGESCVRQCDLPEAAMHALRTAGGGLGHSQLNELLLLLGFDRISRPFFQFLVDGEVEYNIGASLRSFSQLLKGIERFRKLALLMYGSIKHAFKLLSSDPNLLEDKLNQIKAIEIDVLKKRHEAIRPIQKIDPRATYYLGYLIERDLMERLRVDPNDQAAMAEEERRKRVVDIGKSNHEAYLASDHLDVYVATSMRQRHEYVSVANLADAIFSHEELRELNLRWFDPTQAYCGNRIDKGLSEALMLRRAACTIYLAQESDTLGKDSELASTLAQGKPVIAFVPEVDSAFANTLVSDLQLQDPRATVAEVVLGQIQIFDPAAAWRDADVQTWMANPASMTLERGCSKLQERIERHYEQRARTLKDTHPLGIQVNLATGVANGVLVVRSVEDCAKLVRRIVTRNLKFSIDEGEGAINLIEEVSGCIFRTVTSDVMLTNAFWNFYLDQAE
jgi:hypothetical protein